MKCFKHSKSNKDVKDCKFCNYHFRNLKKFYLDQNNANLILPRRKEFNHSKKIETKKIIPSSITNKLQSKNTLTELNQPNLPFFAQKKYSDQQPNQNLSFQAHKITQNLVLKKPNKEHSNFFKITKSLPTSIANSIAMAKIKDFVFLLIFFCFFIYALINFVYIFENKSTFTTFKLMLFSFFLILTIFLIAYFFISNLNLNNFAKNYQKNTDYKKENINFFLKNFYLNHIKWSYYWISLFAIALTYSLVILPILYLLNAHKNQNFALGWFNFGKIPNLSWFIFDWWIGLSIICILTFLNILFNLNFKKSLNYALSENIISEENIISTRKKAKKIALIIYFVFLAILIFFIIFIIISKIKKKAHILKKKSA